MMHFSSGSISSGLGDEGCLTGGSCVSGTCYGKALIFLNSPEGSMKKQDCTFNEPLKSSAAYKNAIIMVLN